MSMFIGRDNSNNSILHITKGIRSLSELKSGILNDTVFHNDLPFYRYKIHKITGTNVKSGYVLGGASGNNWPINNDTGAIYSVRMFGMSQECANDVSSSYTNSDIIVMYLDSNYSEIGISSSDIAFIDYRTNLKYTIDYGITYCPVPYYHNHTMPCLWRNTHIVISYILVLYSPSKLISGNGVKISKYDNSFLIGNTDIKNLQFVSIGNHDSNQYVKKINNKISLIDTSLINGNVSLKMGNRNEILINEFTIFSSVTSLYGIQNIISQYINMSAQRLMNTDNLLFSNITNGDYIYLKIGDTQSSTIFLYTGFFIYSDGLLLNIMNQNSKYYLYCSLGSVYLRIYSTSDYSFSSLVKYSIFR